MTVIIYTQAYIEQSDWQFAYLIHLTYMFLTLGGQESTQNKRMQTR